MMGLAKWRYIHALVSIRLDAFAPLVIDKALDFCAISTPSLEGVPKPAICLVIIISHPSLVD
jgi:hypothetical protein